MLKIEDLHVSIEGKEILKGVNLEVKKGEIHAIMGRNGSGKTTTANVIMGHPDFDVEKGDVILEGESLLELEARERARKGMKQESTRHIYKFVLICIFKDTITQMKEKIKDMGENILLKDIDLSLIHI